MVTFDTNVLVYACDARDSVRQAVAIDLLEQTPAGVKAGGDDHGIPE